MKYEYKVIKVYTIRIDEDIAELNNRLRDATEGWEIFKIIYVPRFRDQSGNDFILHYCRRKVKDNKSKS